jgi:hypothetical protein
MGYHRPWLETNFVAYGNFFCSERLLDLIDSLDIKAKKYTSYSFQEAVLKEANAKLPRFTKKKNLNGCNVVKHNHVGGVILNISTLSLMVNTVEQDITA